VDARERDHERHLERRGGGLMSIAILGAGASGLTLARTLADLGHDDIVVFERSPEVGGKSCTVDIDGLPHDLGATMGVPIDYRHVVGFAREGNIRTVPFPDETHWSLATGKPRRLNRTRELPRVFAQAAQYVRMHGRAGAAPWRDFVDEHGLHAASKRMLCYRTGYGYGFDDEVPALMYANLVQPQTLLGLALAKPFMWSGGTQPIWTRLAQRLPVEIRTSTPITRIARDAHGASVWSKGRCERFDRIAITCDPGQLLPILDASAAESRWFSSIRTYPYATVACEVLGLTPGTTSVGYLDDNMCRARIGHPMAWVKRYADRDIYIFHLFAPDSMPDAEVARRIGEDVVLLGGKLARVHAMKRWRFFPHFTSEHIAAGGMRAIDAWQGQHATYLVGEALSFSTMARVTEHAVAMAHRISKLPMVAAAKRAA
jgi:phytoene dehydrogenase-like protein